MASDKTDNTVGGKPEKTTDSALFAESAMDMPDSTRGEGNSGYECGRVLRLYMERLAAAEPLEQDYELSLWKEMQSLHRRIREKTCFFGCTYQYAIRLLETRDTPESLNDIFPQSMMRTPEQSIQLLNGTHALRRKFADIHARMRTAFAGQDFTELEKLRSSGVRLLDQYPFLIELVFDLLDQLRSHRLVMESGDAAARSSLLENQLLCGAEEFEKQMDALEKLVGGLEEKRNILVGGNLRLVVSIAKKFQGRGVPFIDLIQEGNIGLMKAIEKFDYQLGHRFSTYATWWIKQCVFHAVGRQSRVIRLPMHMLSTLHKISKTEQQFLQENGREATPDEIAAKLDMTRERVNSLKRMAMQSISLQAPVFSWDSGKDVLLEDTVKDMHDEDDPMHSLAKKILSQKLEEILDTLPPRTRQVLALRYGLDGKKPMSLTGMSQYFKISRERIRQIETNALAKMRNPETISKLEDYFS